MSGRGPPLPIRRLDGTAPRGAAPSPRQRGGERAPGGLSNPTPFTDDVSAQLLHHVLGLDCRRPARPSTGSPAVEADGTGPAGPGVAYARPGGALQLTR